MSRGGFAVGFGGGLCSHPCSPRRSTALTPRQRGRAPRNPSGTEVGAGRTLEGAQPTPQRRGWGFLPCLAFSPQSLETPGFFMVSKPRVDHPDSMEMRPSLELAPWRCFTLRGEQRWGVSGQGVTLPAEPEPAFLSMPCPTCNETHFHVNVRRWVLAPRCVVVISKGLVISEGFMAGRGFCPGDALQQGSAWCQRQGRMPR